MTKITLFCTGALARARVEGRITRGMVGLTVEIRCDESWEGLTRSLICRNGEDSWVMAGIHDSTVVPWEALTQEGRLSLCLEGRNAEGALVLPTSWADCGLIYDSGSGEPGSPAPTPDQAQQLLILADQAAADAASARETAQAVQLAARQGEFQGEAGRDGHSPCLSEDRTWLIFSDALQEYVDTGISAIGDASASLAVLENTGSASAAPGRVWTAAEQGAGWAPAYREELVDTITMQEDTLSYTLTEDVTQFSSIMVAVDHSYLVTTGLTGSNWMRIGQVGVSFAPSYPQTTLFLQRMEENRWMCDYVTTNNPQTLVLKTATRLTLQPSDRALVWTLANAEYAHYYSSTNTVIRVYGVRI